MSVAFLWRLPVRIAFRVSACSSRSWVSASVYFIWCFIFVGLYSVLQLTARIVPRGLSRLNPVVMVTDNKGVEAKRCSV